MRALLLGVLALVAACGRTKPPYSPPPPISQGAQPQQTPQGQSVGAGSASPAASTDERPGDRPTDAPK